MACLCHSDFVWVCWNRWGCDQQRRFVRVRKPVRCARCSHAVCGVCLQLISRRLTFAMAEQQQEHERAASVKAVAAVAVISIACIACVEPVLAKSVGWDLTSPDGSADEHLRNVVLVIFTSALGFSALVAMIFTSFSDKLEPAAVVRMALSAAVIAGVFVSSVITSNSRAVWACAGGIAAISAVSSFGILFLRRHFRACVCHSMLVCAVVACSV